MTDTKASPSSLAGKRAVVVVQSDKVGGAERYLTRLYAALASAGVEVHIVGNLPGWNPSYGEVHHVGLSPKWSRRTLLPGLLKLPRERTRVRNVVRLIQPDWIHIQFKREQIGFTQILSRIAPIIWTEHGVFPRSMTMLKLGYARASSHVAQIICVSDLVAESIHGLVRVSNLIRVIENSVDNQIHRPATLTERAQRRRELNIALDAFVVLWAARMDRAKMPEVAISYARKVPRHTVIMLGEGTELDKAVQASKELANLRVVGFVANVAQYYDSADVFLFSSSGKGEGLATTISEASAHDLPIVTHKGSSMENVVLETGGCVVDNLNNVAAWKLALREAAATRGSVTRRTWARKHSLTGWLSAHVEVFLSMLR